MLFEMKLTKIDIAEAHLTTAVRGLFRQEHPASILLLAGSAREILTTLGEKMGVPTALHEAAARMGKDVSGLIKTASEHVGFLKHADHNPTGVLNGLSQRHVDQVLYIACNDFGRIARGQPVELQVYEAWFLAQHFPKISSAPLRMQELLRNCIRYFNTHSPGFRSAPRNQQTQAGAAALARASLDPTLIMLIEREVKLPVGAP